MPVTPSLPQLSPLSWLLAYFCRAALGFYGSQIKKTCVGDRFGLDFVFAESVKGTGIQEETPQFVYAFNNYCVTSGKLSPSKFRISVNGFQTPNDNYVRILEEEGTPLIEQLIEDSGIEEFRAAITRYLTKEKRPQLFANLADDLQPLCISLRKHYMAVQRDLDSQPREIEAMKARELERLSQELQQIGQKYRQHIEKEVNLATNGCPEFEQDFRRLQARMISRLDELLDTFSVRAAYERATLSHRRNATAPLIAVLVEAVYELANQLEDVLVESCQEVTASFFQRLMERVRKSDYYRDLYRLLGNDSEIEENLKVLEKQVTHALVSAARVECDRFVRESPRFYDEGTFSIYQFRQTLLQTSQGYDCEIMVEAEPEIRQLLKLDFEPKVFATIRRNFRQTMNMTIKSHLLPAIDQQADEILQQYNCGRAYLEQTLSKEAADKIAKNLRLEGQYEKNIDAYNQTVAGINGCLEAMQLFKHLLPHFGQSDLIPVSIELEDINFRRGGVGVFESNGMADAVKVES